MIRPEVQVHRVRVKICGLTRPDDVKAAADAGADAVGFVFYPPSPRHVSVAQCARLLEALPAFVTSVGLFVDPDESFVRAVLDQVPLDLLQFHGDEPQAFCSRFSRPYIKAVRMKPDTDLDAVMDEYHNARALLVDSYVPGLPGGTGQTFDWGRLPDESAVPLVLAGGLDPDNVASAVKQVGPWAVDVSGGVECLDEAGNRQPGIKSAEAINAFMRGVNSV